MVSATKIARKIGTRIKINRLERGWSQQKLATEAGMSREFISMLENDKRAPSFEAFQKIATAFGKNPAAFLGEQPDDNNERIVLALLLQEIAEDTDTERLRKLVEFAQSLDI